MEIISDTNLSRGEHSFSNNLNKLKNGVYLLVTQIDGKIIFINLLIFE